MQLIAITPPYFYAGEGEAIGRALTGEFARVHIRKPGSTPGQMALLLASIPPEFRHRITLHDHLQLAEQFGIGGVHLNSRNPVAPQGWSGLVSRSVHSPQEAMDAAGNYLLLSPIFPSFSKPGHKPEITFDDMAKAASARVYALGGVTWADLRKLEKAGFGGAAMLTEAWRKPFDMNAFCLQFITHPNPEQDGVVEGARQALDGGCRWIQLRHKGASEQTLVREGREIAAMCRRNGATFIIDDHVELVETLGADGVHLGKNDMPVEQARRILGPSKIIGATANTFADLSDAAHAGADYAGVGPFRFTTTKKNLSPVLGLDGYRNILAKSREMGLRLPIVAIGGITPADIPAVMATGVNGIAASSTILQSENPMQATGKIIETLNLVCQKK